MSPTATFLEIVNSADRSDDLVIGALALAAHDHDVDVDHQLRRLDELALACPEPTLEGLRHGLFVEAGFAGRTDDYYAPENSYLDHVVDTRLGLPISLSVLSIEVGRRVGLELVGVGMPAHFLVRSLHEPDRFLDPFHGGVEVDAAGCRALFHGIAGAKAPFRSDYLRPASTPAVLGRMASNLVNAFRRRDDRAGMRWSARLRAHCPGVGPGELIALSQTLARTGAVDEAADLIDRALPSLDGDEIERWTREAARLRAQLN
jgi:hypothetical protein